MRWIQRRGDRRKIDAAISFLETIKDEQLPVFVEVDKYKRTRSQEQNRYYWQLLTQISSRMPDHMDGEWHSREAWHVYFRTRFLEGETIEVDGVTVPVPKSTRMLNTSEMSDYITQVEAWFGEQGEWMQ